MFETPDVVMFINSLKIVVNEEEPERELVLGFSLGKLTRELAEFIPGPVAFHVFPEWVVEPKNYDPDVPREELGAKWWPFKLDLPRYQVALKTHADVSTAKILQGVEVSDVKVKKPPKTKYPTLDFTVTLEFPEADIANWLCHQVGRHAACTFQEEQLSLLGGSQVSKATGELVEPPVASEEQPTIDTVLTSSEVVGGVG